MTNAFLKQIFLFGFSTLALIGCAGESTLFAALTPTPIPIVTLTPEPTVPAASASPQASATPSPKPTTIRTLAPTPPLSPHAIPTPSATAPLTAAANTTQPPDGKALLQSLQNGGYTIVFRHAITDPTQSDTIPQVLQDCAKQRNLNEQGRMQAREIGTAISTLKIPIGIVLSSPYCRTRETAMLAFGRAETTSRLDNAFINTDRRAELQAALEQLVGDPPSAGTNTVLVTHGDNIRRALGVTVAEGEAVIVLRDGSGGFSIITQVPSLEWKELQ